MQYFVKQRATETGDITFYTPAIDVDGMPFLTHELIVYSIAGSTPDFSVALQTSSDLLTWTAVGTGLSRTSAGADIQATLASQYPYSRYVRYEITIGGTITSVEYSLILNTYASS